MNYSLEMVSIIHRESVSFHLFKLSGIEKIFAKKILWVKFIPTKTSETNTNTSVKKTKVKITKQGKLK